MTASWVVYIDESGDEGFLFDKGSSEWFVLSAVVTQKATDLETVKLVDRVRAQILKRTDHNPLHFRKLKHEHRIPFLHELLQHQTQFGDVQIDWNVIKREQITAYSAKRMGLQLADAVASAFFFGVQLNQYGFVEDRYARMLHPIMYKHSGRYSGYGLKLWPKDIHATLKTRSHLVWLRDVYGFDF